MEGNSRKGKRIWLVSFFVFFTAYTVLVFGQKQPASSEAGSVTWRVPAEGQASDYIGRETCAGCHPSEDKQYGKTVHAHAQPEGATYGTGCEACHGPGKAHAEAQMNAGGDAAKTEAGKKLIFSFHGKPEENSARCLACHNTSRDQALFSRSEHKIQGVSCDACHASHLLERTEKRARTELSPAQSHFFSVPKLTEENRWLQQSLLKKSQPELCYSCHQTIQSQFALPTHHRVPEGLMKCTDCHNAHGTLQRPLLRKSNWEACLNCHMEKRGPFLFEHAAVKVEGCTICHSPHGTVTRHLLTRREDRFTCLECHVNPFAGNVPHGRLSWATRGECTRCHVNIHGSNISRYFLQ